jgi:hypothetical protein
VKRKRTAKNAGKATTTFIKVHDAERAFVIIVIRFLISETLKDDRGFDKEKVKGMILLNVDLFMGKYRRQFPINIIFLTDKNQVKK